MRCPYCGGETDANRPFCRHCGKRIDSIQVEPVPTGQTGGERSPYGQGRGNSPAPYPGRGRESRSRGDVLMIVIGIIWLITYNAEELYVPVKEVKTEASGRKTAIAGGLLITIMIMAVFAVSDNFVKDGLTTWAPVIFKSRYGLKDETSILLTLILPVIGVLGAMLSVFLNKYIKDFISLF